jgi:hypothetical protein
LKGSRFQPGEIKATSKVVSAGFQQIERLSRSSAAIKQSHLKRQDHSRIEVPTRRSIVKFLLASASFAEISRFECTYAEARCDQILRV